MSRADFSARIAIAERIVLHAVVLHLSYVKQNVFRWLACIRSELIFPPACRRSLPYPRRCSRLCLCVAGHIFHATDAYAVYSRACSSNIVGHYKHINYGIMFVLHLQSETGIIYNLESAPRAHPKTRETPVAVWLRRSWCDFKQMRVENRWSRAGASAPIIVHVGLFY